MGTRGRLTLATLLLLALAGCSSSGVGTGGAEDDGAVNAGSAAESEVDAEVAMDTTVAEQRQVIVTADASVQVEDPAAAADQVAALAEAVGGRVEGREEYAGGEDFSGSATLVLRIPADELSGVLEDLDDIGTVVSVTQSEQDVTGTVVDLDARIAALETSTDRLLEIMATAEDTGDLLATETQLSERQAELEALQAQRDALADQVALSTLTVSLNTEPVTAVAARGGFLGGLESGWNALVSFVGALLVALGALLPWLVALGGPALIVLLVLRKRRRRAAPTPTPVA